MEAPEHPPQSKRHSRNVSNNKGSLPRRATIGPLDVENPLAPDPTQKPTATEPTTPSILTNPLSPEPPPPTLATLPPRPIAKDFTYLLRPEIYHPIPTTSLPPAFRTPTYQPSPSTPLPTLLKSHHYRSAAIAAATRLATPPQPPPDELFSLLYTRLACLTLIDHLPLAAQEAKALEDTTNPYYVDESTGLNLLPWHLRVLAVRLQSIAFSDSRRGVGGYYDLAREARQQVLKSSDEEEKGMWKTRLRELGLYVASALIEMGDLDAAGRHLRTLPKDGDDEAFLRERRLALVYLNLGDLGTAASFLPRQDPDRPDPFTSTSSTSPSKPEPSSNFPTILPPLLTTNHPTLSSLSTLLLPPPPKNTSTLFLSPSSPTDLLTANKALTLFYTGHVSETITLLEGLVDKGRSFAELTFNLATCYELVCERPGGRKEGLVGRVAETGRRREGVEDGNGNGVIGERGGGGFKL